MRELRPREAAALLAGPHPPRILDVREPWEYALCHLEGALLIPMRELPGRISELDPEVPLLVVCHHGIRSRMVCRYLEREHGFRNLMNLEGGVAAWAAEVDPGMPTY
ncbi:MAG: sulfurtransferase [Gammaproteobacteria bacterium]|nr:MAG: sulfurtransferase [Gammaproteobacteria bacterium]